jgi:VanZ family protein
MESYAAGNIHQVEAAGKAAHVQAKNNTAKSIERFEKKAVSIATVACFLILYTLTHIPPSSGPQIAQQVGDKTLHLVAYLGIGFIFNYWMHCFFRQSSFLLACLSLGVGALFGAFDEWTQPFFARVCDIEDWYADLSGLGFGIALFLFVRSHLPELCQARGAEK